MKTVPADVASASIAAVAPVTYAWFGDAHVAAIVAERADTIAPGCNGCSSLGNDRYGPGAVVDGA